MLFPRDRMNNHSNPSAQRRAFLRSVGVLGASFVTIRSGIASLLPSISSDGDHKLITQRLDDLIAQGPQSMADMMIAAGRSFLGAPYAANTLETSGEEHLVVNLREVDCVTFVENTLALARCAKFTLNSPEAFNSQLQSIRYRGGVINGYPSRLHYFSDWIADNEAKNIVKDISRDLGGVKMDKTIYFMSTHRSAYKQLADDDVLKEIALQEGRINARERWFLPKEKLAAAEKGIRDGDIIAITTRIAGLDVSHTGLAMRDEKDILRFLHAPITGEVVQISKRSMVEHVNASEKYTGLLVARPLEPKES